MAKKSTKKAPNSKPNMKSAHINTETILKKYKVKKISTKPNQRNRSQCSQQSDLLQFSEQNQIQIDQTSRASKIKAQIHSKSQKSTINQRMRETIKYYLQSLKNKDNRKNYQDRIFSVDDSSSNTNIKNANTYKSKPIKKLHKTRFEKRRRSQSATPQVNSREFIEILSSPSSKQGKQYMKLQRQSQLNSSQEKNYSLGSGSNRLKRGKGNMGRNQIKGLFGMGKNLLLMSCDDQRSNSLSKRSSRSGSRYECSQSPIPISSESIANSQNTNSIDRSDLIELQNQPQSPNEEDISSQSINREPEYTVQRIVSSKVTKSGQFLYEIKWLGYPEQDNTYQPLKNLQNVFKMVVKFQQTEKSKIKKHLKEEIKQTKKQLTMKFKQKIDEKDKQNQELSKKYKELEKKIKQIQKIHKVQTSKHEFQPKTKLQTHQLKNLKNTQKPSQAKIQTILGIGITDRKINDQDSIIKISESQVGSTKSSSSMKIQKALQICLIPEKLPNESSMNNEKCQFLSTRHSSQNQQSIIIQKQVFEYGSEDGQIQNLLPVPNIFQFSQEIDYFQSNPIYHHQIEGKLSNPDVSIEFMNQKYTQRDNQDHSGELQMILEENEHSDALKLSYQDLSLIKNLTNQSCGSQEIELMEYSFPMVSIENNGNNKLARKQGVPQLQNQSLLDEFDCLNYFYPNHQKNGI